VLGVLPHEGRNSRALSGFGESHQEIGCHHLRDDEVLGKSSTNRKLLVNLADLPQVQIDSSPGYFLVQSENVGRVRSQLVLKGWERKCE